VQIVSRAIIEYVEGKNWFLPEVSGHEDGLVALGHDGGGGDGRGRLSTRARIRLQLVDRLKVKRVGRVTAVELAAPLARVRRRRRLFSLVGVDQFFQVDAVLLLAETRRVRRLEAAVAAVRADLLELVVGRVSHRGPCPGPCHGPCHLATLAEAVSVVRGALKTSCQLEAQIIYIFTILEAKINLTRKHTIKESKV